MLNETIEKSVSGATLARLFDCDQRTIRNLADKSIVIRTGRGRYELEESVRGYVTHLRSIAAGRGETDGSLTAARVRLAQAKAAQAEVQIKVAARELVAADDVFRKWSNAFATIRRCVMGLPARIASDLNLTRADAARIDDHVRDTLNEAADEIGAIKID